MSLMFEELDSRTTPLGEISLRRRADPRLDGKILYEVKLGEEFLMSSLFTEAEIQLSRLALNALKETQHQNNLDVVVGGLGLGYTALAALESEQVNSLVVVDVMEAVIQWHQQGLVPLGEKLTADARCSLLHADFFALCASAEKGFYADASKKLAHAILLDIDHSPAHWLNQGNSQFYTQQGLQGLASKMYPGGVFGLWSNDLPDDAFVDLLKSVFTSVETHIVEFSNPYTLGVSTNSVYLARRPD